MNILIRRLVLSSPVGNAVIGVIATDANAEHMVGLFLATKDLAGKEFIGDEDGAYSTLCAQIACQTALDGLSIAETRLKDGLTLTPATSVETPTLDGFLNEAATRVFCTDLDRDDARVITILR